MQKPIVGKDFFSYGLLLELGVTFTLYEGNKFSPLMFFFGPKKAPM